MPVLKGLAFLFFNLCVWHTLCAVNAFEFESFRVAQRFVCVLWKGTSFSIKAGALCLSETKVLVGFQWKSKFKTL